MWTEDGREDSASGLIAFVTKLVIIDTGFPGVLFILSFGQLMPQLIASKFPVFFMNIPGVGIVSRIALLLESVGVTHFSWLLAHIVQRILCLKDESVLFVDGGVSSDGSAPGDGNAAERGADFAGDDALAIAVDRADASPPARSE
jgi:hypothetical protein